MKNAMSSRSCSTYGDAVIAHKRDIIRTIFYLIWGHQHNLFRHALVTSCFVAGRLIDRWIVISSNTV
jgi:hypothetical protein